MIIGIEPMIIAYETTVLPLNYTIFLKNFFEKIEQIKIKNNKD